VNQPLQATEARSQIRQILDHGALLVSRHFKQKLRQQHMVMSEVLSALRNGTVDEAEWENGSWRHRVRTSRLVVVVAFASESELALVTTWRAS
jgi:hypothetical protein